MPSVQGCKSQCQGGANVTFQSLVAATSPPWISSWVGLGEQVQNLLFTCKFWGLPKTVGWDSQSSSLKQAASGRRVAGGRLLSAGSSSKTGAEHQGSMRPATVAPRPTLQTTFGSDMWITKRGNKTSPNAERTSGMGTFKLSSALHSACQHTSLTFNVKSKQMCLSAGWLSSTHFFPSLNMLIMVSPNTLH